MDNAIIDYIAACDHLPTQATIDYLRTLPLVEVRRIITRKEQAHAAYSQPSSMPVPDLRGDTPPRLPLDVSGLGEAMEVCGLYDR